jgi:hypothetical protein
MAQYALLLNCSTAGSVSENEGDFDSVAWVSPTGNACPNPNTASLSLNPADQVTFLVQVKDANGVLQPGFLNWIVVMVTAETAPGNRSNRYANNNSPFRIGAAAKPNTVLLANSGGAGSTTRFTPYNANGVATPGGPYQGFPYLSIVADVPPGSTRPTRPVSQYESAIVASVTDASGNLWQFGFDPEMDVNNGSSSS